MKLGKWMLGVVAVAVAIGAYAYLHKRSGEQPAGQGPGQRGGAAGAPARVVPVIEAKVTRRDVPLYLDGLGAVQANRTVTVKPQIDGRLDKVLFTEGQEVKRGTLLALIDPRPFQIQLHTAEGALARDQAQLQNARLNLKRYAELREKKMVAQQQVDDASAQVGQLEGVIRIDRAQIESARLNLDYTRITSPLDAVTGVRLVDPGNIVRQADPNGLVVLTQLDPIAVLFSLPQDELPRVSEAMQGGTLLVEAFSRDGQTKLGTGDLRLIDNQINAATATLRLKAIFPNPQRVLWPNQFVKARLLLTTRRSAIVIPAAAIQRGPDGLFVYSIQDDSTVQTRGVEVETTQGELAIIGKGLQGGERIVIEGQNQLRPGAKVSTRDPGAGQKGPARSGAEAAAPKLPPAQGRPPPGEHRPAPAAESAR